MKDLIKEVALEVAREMYVGESAVVERYSLDKFLELGLVELSKRAEAVGEMHESHTKPPKDADGHWCKEILLYSPNNPGDLPKYRVPVFTFPPTHDIEAIENRVAEACAKACIKEAVQIVIDGPEERAYNNATSDCAEAIKSGAWRKYK